MLGAGRALADKTCIQRVWPEIVKTFLVETKSVFAFLSWRPIEHRVNVACVDV